MRGGGSRLEASGGNFAKRRRERYSRERQRYNRSRPVPDDGGWWDDDDEADAER